MTCSLAKVSGGKRRRQRGGQSATAWGNCISGGMNQVAAAGQGNAIAFAPVASCVKGGSRRRSRSRRRASRSSKRGGSLIGDIAIPAAFLWANTTFGSRGKTRTSKRRSSRRR